MRVNQKALSSMKIIRSRANQKRVNKSINTKQEKDTIDETEHEETLVTNNLVINEPRYVKLFECGRNILNRIDATYKQVCMATSRDRYYTMFFRTLTYYTDHNNTPLSNKKI